MTVAQASLYGALIGAGAVLAAGIATIGGSLFIERRRDRRDTRKRRDAAVRELMTATVDLVSGVHAVRGAYEGTFGWRWRFRLVAAVFAAMCSVFAAAGDISLGVLLDWRHSGRLVDRLLAEDRHLNEAQRTAAMDIAGVVTARAARFFAALAAVTLGGGERELSEAANRLAEAVGGLLEAMGGKPRRYQEARARAERALSDFRRVADRQK